MRTEALRRGSVYAVLAAIAFGLTTPTLARLGAGASPLSTATLLYLGAALAAGTGRLLVPTKDAPLQSRHLGRVAVVALLGAALAPTSSRGGSKGRGLSRAPCSSTSRRRSPCS